jgi:hypothetical protein
VEIIFLGCDFPCLSYEFVMEDIEVSVVLGGMNDVS